jgi:hypothetical protein
MDIHTIAGEEDVDLDACCWGKPPVPILFRHGPASQFASITEGLETTNTLLEDLAALEIPDAPVTKSTTSEGPSEMTPLCEPESSDAQNSKTPQAAVAKP